MLQTEEQQNSNSSSPQKAQVNKNSEIPANPLPKTQKQVTQDKIDTCNNIGTITKLPTTNAITTTTKLDSDEKLDQQEIKIQVSEFNVDKQNNFFYKLTFCVLGLSSIIGWNAILSSFSFFESKYGVRVYTTFTIPLQIGTFLVGAIIPFIASKISIVWRISGAMVVMTFIMAALPIIAQLLPSESDDGDDTGFIISIILIFFLGTSNSSVQNSMAGLAAQEGGKLCGIYWTFNGVSGLLMSLLSIICTLIFSSNDSNDDSSFKSTIVFFSFALVLLICSIYLSKQYAKKENLDNKNQQNKNFNKQLIIKAIKYAGALPFVIGFIFIVTFMVFPGLMLANVDFTANFLSKNDGLWGLQLLNLTFQIGDVSGRQLGANSKFHKKIPQYILTFGRLIFLVTGILVAYEKGGDVLNNNWFPFVNMFLMAFTNGFNTACLMGLGPKYGKGNKDIIEIIGFICAFMLTFGIAIGSLIAYPLAPSN